MLNSVFITKSHKNGKKIKKINYKVFAPSPLILYIKHFEPKHIIKNTNYLQLLDYVLA